MTLDALILLAILAATVAAFVREWLPIDVVALACLAAMLLFDLITPQEAVSGFGNEAVVTVMMIFILSDALIRSGLIAKLAHRVAELSGETHWRGSLLLLGVAGVLSAFINNVAALTIFMPVSMHLAKHYRVSPTKLLLPLSFATIFGGACTLVGTSTNLIISSLASEFGFQPIGMFELAGLGGVLFVLGIAYIALFPMRQLPDRASPDSLTGKYGMRSYLTELRVPRSSRLIGRTALGERLSERFRVNMLEIIRTGERIAVDLRAREIEADDTLIVRGTMEDIVAFKERYGLLLLTEHKLSDKDLADRDNVLVEVQVAPGSDLVGRTIQELDFRRRFGCFVLALQRPSGVIRRKVAFVPLKELDTLLVFGPRQRVDALEQSDELNPVQEVELHLQLRPDWWIAALIVPAVVLLAAFGVMSIVESSILGVVALLITRCIKIEQAYRSINWAVIFLVAAILPVGKAMVSTGLAEAVGHGLVSVAGGLGPIAVLALLYLATTVLTEVISNNSAAVLMVPISLEVAAGLGLDSRTFLMAVAFAASASFLTPMGYKTNAMVYGPGAYRFTDYLRTGTPLKILFWILTTALLPVFWPLQPAAG
ncbi:MAG: SLC13 family permease [Acidobacteriota bacterium]